MKHVGILGAGQLGRMLALAGYPLELDFHLYEPSGKPSAGIGKIINDPAPAPDSPLLQQFMADVDVVTYEFEHLPLDIVRQIAQHKTLRPGIKSLEVCQHRALEKGLFDKLGIPTPAYAIVQTEQALIDAVTRIGCPVVAKTTTEGYDGKGQVVIRDISECAQAWATLKGVELIVEQFVRFERELSIIAVRAEDDDIRIYPLAENVHHQGILRYSTAPAPKVREETQTLAENYIKSLLRELDHVGVLTLELFETASGLLANEMAPRVHNSGHWSIEGAACSQFENHLRAVCGLPLGDVAAYRPTCMINIIAEKGDIHALLRFPYVHLHLYGKEERAGRKLGHITIQADSHDELVWRVRNVAALLPGSPEFDGYR